MKNAAHWLQVFSCSCPGVQRHRYDCLIVWILAICAADRSSHVELPSVDSWCCWITSTHWLVTSCQASLQVSRHVSAAVRCSYNLFNIHYFIKVPMSYRYKIRVGKTEENSNTSPYSTLSWRFLSLSTTFFLYFGSHFSNLPGAVFFRSNGTSIYCHSAAEADRTSPNACQLLTLAVLYTCTSHPFWWNFLSLNQHSPLPHRHCE